MNSIYRRTWFALGLCSILLFGALTFGIRYLLYADKWVVYQGSPHVYNDQGTMNTGIVTDRNGTMLLDASGDVTYAGSELLRKSTVHLLGDREGNIADRILPYYSDLMLGYDKLNGTYSAKSGEGSCSLTISGQVQEVALQALNGKKGTVGVYNYKTGEILCAVTSPTFDPDHVPDIENDTTGQYDGAYINRLFYSSYTPGSIFKLITTMAALEHIPGIEDEKFVCEGQVIINGEVITCPKAHGTVSLKEALASSCNCTYGTLSVRLGAEILTATAKKAGITDKLSFDGIITRAGSYDLTAADNNGIAWSGIGQYTDLVNPCQYMMYMGVLGGGGKAAYPYLVSEVRCGEKVTYQAKTRTTAQLFSQEAVLQLQRMMRNNVETVYGTGAFPKVNVCAKSGTAETGATLCLP